MTAAGRILFAAIAVLWCTLAVVVATRWHEPCTARWDRCQ